MSTLTASCVPAVHKVFLLCQSTCDPTQSLVHPLFTYSSKYTVSTHSLLLLCVLIMATSLIVVDLCQLSCLPKLSSLAGFTLRFLNVIHCLTLQHLIQPKYSICLMLKLTRFNLPHLPYYVVLNIYKCPIEIRKLQINA